MSYAARLPTIEGLPRRCLCATRGASRSLLLTARGRKPRTLIGQSAGGRSARSQARVDGFPDGVLVRRPHDVAAVTQNLGKDRAQLFLMNQNGAKL